MIHFGSTPEIGEIDEPGFPAVVTAIIGLVCVAIVAGIASLFGAK